MKTLILFLFITPIIYANSIHLDIGSTETNFNRFSIPNSDANQLTMPDEGSLTSFRLTGYYELANKNQLYFLLAPLTADYSFISNKSFNFDGVSFNNATTTNVSYKFNSYRFGYLWTWNSGALKYWLGAVAKIRDAEVSVAQGSTSAAYDNVGLVPLASFGFELKFLGNLSIFSHTDAMTASQGSAYDSSIELKYHLDKNAISFGKRILGGGADNDKVYSFAQFDTLYLRFSRDF